MSDAPATRRDLAELRSEIVERFATKQDLERFATKQDLERFATKQDLERFATKQDLAEGLDRLRTEMRVELRADLRADLALDIEQAITRVANVMMEHIQGLIAVVEDKYQDTPREIAALRAALDEHIHDTRVHVAPATPPKRTRRRAG